ncbi:MAG: glycoside hydrolase family 5 protein [Acutalibacteraceae bacterium]|jgi:endoglucanase
MIELPIKRGINYHTQDYALTDELATEKYFKITKEAGFDHVRLPVRGAHLEERGNEYLDHVREVCETSLKCGLIPIMDLHWYRDMNKDPLAHKDNFLDLWEKIAAYWADMDERVIFEICNEPTQNYNSTLLNEVQNEAIRRIRKSNPTRLLAAACAHYNTIENLHFLELPEDDKNIFVTIHDYTPMALTHQGMGNRPVTDYQWDSQQMRDYITARFDVAKAWSVLNDRAIHLGEFGVNFNIAMQQRVSWTAFMVKLCEERGFAFSYWEFWKGFGAYNRKDECWHHELLKALIQE